MEFQLDLKDSYDNIRMCLGNALIVATKFVWLISAFWPFFSLKRSGIPTLF